MRWHPSPAFVGGSKGPGQKFRVPCKLANCVKPSCPFLHFSPANQYQRPTAFREMHGLIREECKDGSACTSKGCCYWHPSPEAAKSADDKCSSTPSGFTTSNDAFTSPTKPMAKRAASPGTSNKSVAAGARAAPAPTITTSVPQATRTASLPRKASVPSMQQQKDAGVAKPSSNAASREAGRASDPRPPRPDAARNAAAAAEARAAVKGAAPLAGQARKIGARRPPPPSPPVSAEWTRRPAAPASPPPTRPSAGPDADARPATAAAAMEGGGGCSVQ